MTVLFLRAIWTLIATCGLIFTTGLLIRSINDYRIVSKNDPTEINCYAAATGIYLFAGGAIMQLSFFVVGITALIQSTTEDTPTTHLQYVSATIFTLASLISTINAGIVFYRRRRLVEILYEHQIIQKKEDRKELDTYRKTDEKDLKDYIDVDRKDLADYRDHDVDYPDKQEGE